MVKKFKPPSLAFVPTNRQRAEEAIGREWMPEEGAGKE